MWGFAAGRDLRECVSLRTGALYDLWHRSCQSNRASASTFGMNGWWYVSPATGPREWMREILLAIASVIRRKANLDWGCNWIFSVRYFSTQIHGLVRTWSDYLAALRRMALSVSLHLLHATPRHCGYTASSVIVCLKIYARNITLQIVGGLFWDIMQLWHFVCPCWWAIWLPCVGGYTCFHQCRKSSQSVYLITIGCLHRINNATVPSIRASIPTRLVFQELYETVFPRFGASDVII